MKGWHVVDKNLIEEKTIDEHFDNLTCTKVKITKALLTLKDAITFSEGENKGFVLGGYGIGVVSEEGENLLDNNIGETAVNRLGEAILKGVNTVEMYYKRFDELKSIVKTPIPLSAFHDAKRAGRPKASTDKHLKDFLKRCDSCTVTQAVMNCPYRDKPGFFGQLLIALLDLGYIEISDIGKELYKAIKNDFPEAPSIDSIRKICPQNKGLIDEYRSSNKHKIEDIKKLF